MNAKRIVPESQRSHSYIDENGNVVCVVHAGITVSVSSTSKIIGKMPSEQISKYVRINNPHLQYVMQEYYAALGTEGIRSKYFHLFCIIEFIEREYTALAGAEPILSKDQLSELDEKFRDILDDRSDLNKTIKERIVSGTKGCLQKMTVEGRAQKLVNILRAMDIERIEDGGICFDIEKKRMDEYIQKRNNLFHGNQADENLPKYVTELMCIDLKVLEYLRDRE